MPRRAATCRGFAVGRTIFQEPARAWLAERRSTTRRSMRARARATSKALIDAWRGGAACARSATAKGARRMTHACALDDGAGAGPLPRRAAHATSSGARRVPLFGGVLGDLRPRQRRRHRRGAVRGTARELPTYRAHNEQAMAHAAIAYAKAHFRRRMMACTTSIGPGATNMVTAAALAHVNRLPVLFLPGDVFVVARARPGAAAGRGLPRRHASRPTTASGRCRATSTASSHPAQLLTALPRAMRVLTDPALCGPVTLALPQDVQAMAYDYPGGVLRADARARSRAPPPDASELDAAAALLRAAKRPLIVAGGGVLYAPARPTRCARSPKRTACRSPRRRPARARCRGTIRCSWARSASPARRPPTRSPREADVVLAVGTRLQDFTTGSHSLFAQARARRRSTSTPSTRASWRGSPLRRRRAARARGAVGARSAAGAPTPAGSDRAQRAADDWRADVARITGGSATSRCRTTAR